MTKKRYFFIRLILSGIIIGGTIFLLFFNPFFEIQKWEIEETELIDETEINNYLNDFFKSKGGVFPKNNFFVFTIRRQKISREIEKEFKVIKKASFGFSWDEKIFKQVSVFLEERKTLGIICPSSDDLSCFFFDKEGFLFKKSPESKGPFILKVKNTLEPELKLGDKIEEPKLIEAITQIEEQVSLNTDLSIREIEIINQNYDFILHTGNNWKIYFDPKEEIQRQCQVLKTLISEEKVKVNENIEYIDLRIKNKAYIKR